MLCPVFTTLAQSKSVHQELQIGQTVPLAAGLAAYKGKLLILDFWATWCAPCRTLIPKSDSLNVQFKDRALILPVTYEKATIAGPVLAQIRKNIHLGTPELFSDVTLHQLFPHKVLPHEVWIDTQGRVRAITEGKAITAFTIRRALERDIFPNEQKKDLKISYDTQLPLFLSGNGGDGATLSYHSLLSAFVPGLPHGMDISRFDSVRGQLFSARNVPLSWLFRMAYGENNRWFSKARIKNESRDSLVMRSPGSGKMYDDWLAAGHGYCYELLLPPRLATQAYSMMQADMARLFPQYRVTVEKRKVPCLVLISIGPDSLFKSRGGPYLVQVTPFACTLRQATLNQLLIRLDHQYLQNSPYPIIDGTGFTGRTDISFTANMNSIAEINRGLAPYGLRFVVQPAETELLMIRDNTDLPPHKP